MPFKKRRFLFVFISFLSSVLMAQKQTVTSNVIPIPSKIIYTEGNFILNSSKGINFDTKFEISANFLKSYIETGSTIKLQKNNSIFYHYKINLLKRNSLIRILCF